MLNFSSKFREASFEVFDVLTNFDSEIIIEKASVDEAYVDLTDYLNKHQDLELPSKDEMPDCYVEGCDDLDSYIQMITNDPDTYRDEINLLKGAKIVKMLRDLILEKTEFHCSAGISHSKVLAKLGASIHKPKSQTILPNCGKKQLLSRTEIQKLRSLGGKFGLQIIERLNIQYVDQINNFTIEQLRALFDEKTADYLVNMANGIDNEKVVARKAAKSIGCGKNFSAVGVNCLDSKDQVEHWINQLVEELFERLERDKELNNRRPTLLVVSVNQSSIGMLSRSTQFDTNLSKERLVEQLMERILNPLLFKKDTKVSSPIRMLSVAATKFVDIVDHKGTIVNFFQKMQQKNESSEINEIPNATNDHVNNENDNVNNEVSEDDGAPSPKRSRTEFKNLNCKKMMDDYFKELEADLQPKDTATTSKPKLTIVNMFTKIAEQNGQDLKAKPPCDNIDQPIIANKPQIKTNPIIDLINRKNQRVNMDIDPNQPSTSNQAAEASSFDFKQLQLIREQGLLDEEELKKLEKEILNEQAKKVEKIGFFRRKTLEFKEKRKCI